MAHPNEDTRSVFPHLIVPGFVHALHILKIDELCLLAKLLKALRGSIPFIHRLAVISRPCIRSLLAEEMAVPHSLVIFCQLFVSRQRPTLFFGNEKTGAFIRGERSHSYLGTKTVAIVDAVGISGFIEGKVAC